MYDIIKPASVIFWLYIFASILQYNIDFDWGKL